TASSEAGEQLGGRLEDDPASPRASRGVVRVEEPGRRQAWIDHAPRAGRSEWKRDQLAVAQAGKDEPARGVERRAAQQRELRADADERQAGRRPERQRVR